MSAIKKLYDAGVSDRTSHLQRVREASAYTIPTVLRQEGDGSDRDILQAYQNIGGDGMTNLVNKTLAAMYPAAQSWFRQVPSPKTRLALAKDQKTLSELESHLYSRELLVRSKLDSSGYRVKERVALEQLFVSGNTLTQITSDYKIRCFRIDQWVQKMTSGFELDWLVIEEEVEAESLSNEMLAKANLKRQDYDNKSYNDKKIKMYTLIDTQKDRSVVITQEINGVQIAETEETVSPFVHAVFHEVPGENYARSFVELKMGDLRSLNGLAKALLDNAAIAARNLVAVDETKGVRPSDLLRRNGSIISARVTGGQIEGIGILKSDKHQDFTVTLSTAEMIQQRLSKSMLLELENQPQGERVTATQISMIAAALDGAMGGIFPQISLGRQEPLLRRFMHQMEKDALLVPLPKKDGEITEIQILTGIEAMSRATDLERLLRAMQILQQIPGGTDGLRMETVRNRILEGSGVNTDGLLLTEEEMQAKQREAAEQAMQMMAGQKAIDTAGNIAENSAAAQPQAAA